MDMLSTVGLSSVDLVALMVAATAFLAIISVWSALLDRDPMAKRTKSLQATRDGLRSNLLAPQRGHRTRKALNLTQMANTVVARLNLMRSSAASGLSLRLAQGGIRNRDAVTIYLFAKLILPFAAGGLALAYLQLLAPPDLHPNLPLPLAMVAVLLGAALPNVWLSNLCTRRKQALRKGLPDALDLLVICAEAGLSLDAALTRVSKEMGRSNPDVADEFGLTAIELGFLPERRAALENLGNRVDLQEMRSVMNTMLQTERYGTPLAQSLMVLAKEFRNERMLKAEDKAAKLPATLTVPMILFILPALFVVLLGPALIQALDGLTKSVF